MSLPDRIPGPVFYRLLAWHYRLREPEVGRLRELVAPGTTAVDVGAWWGPWTYWLSHATSRVVAFEPIPRLAGFLAGVAGDGVEVVNAALSDRRGDARLWVPRGGTGSEGLSSLHPVAGVETVPVDVRTERLDDHDLEGVGFVKIDVEGHELAVLRGAEATVARCRPVLLVEIEQRHHERPMAEVFDAINALGYHGRFLDGRHWRPIDDFDVERRQLRYVDRAQRRGALSYAIPRRGGYRNNFAFFPD